MVAGFAKLAKGAGLKILSVESGGSTGSAYWFFHLTAITTNVISTPHL